MGIFFIKLPKHYVFDYKPMYYDPKKERFKHIDEQEKAKNKEGTSYRPDIKFRRYYSYHRRSNRNALLNLFVTLTIMILLFLAFFYLPVFSKLWELLLQK